MKNLVLILAAGAALAAAGAANATVYTQDTNLADFDTGLVWGTFSNFLTSKPAGPFTPTPATIATNSRVAGGKTLPGLPTTNNWMLVTFASPTSVIRVIPDMDQYGVATDGYQYTIEGSNDGKTWTSLFDVTKVLGTGPQFTIGAFKGTAPNKVDNIITGGVKDQAAGYIADFRFKTAYKYYAFGGSTQAFLYGDGKEPADRAVEPELDGVGTTSTALKTGAFAVVPEPGTWAMMLTGIGALGLLARRRRALAGV